MFDFTRVEIMIGTDADDPGVLFSTTLNLNGDRFPDLLLTLNEDSLNQVARLPIVLLQSNGTTLIDVTDELLPDGLSLQFPRDLHVADFNGDGRDDVFFSNHGTEAFEPFPGERNRLLLSTEDGGYVAAPRANLPGFADFSHLSSVGDFDGDGDVDIYVNNLGSVGGFESYLMLNDGTGRFAIVDNLPDSENNFDSLPFGGHGTYGTIAFDADNDGDIDIFHDGRDFFDFTELDFRYFENDGAGSFFLTDNPLPSIVPPLHIEAGDVTGDGFIDVLIYEDTGKSQNGVGSNFQLLINDGAGGFMDASAQIEGNAALRNNPDAGFAPEVQLVDLDGDGDLDIFSIGFNRDFTGTVSYTYLNDGDGEFTRVALKDLPADRPGSFAIDVNDSGGAEFFSDTVFSDIFNQDNRDRFVLFEQASLIPEPDVTGTRFADQIVGGGRADFLVGLRGGDTLLGRGGADTLDGGGGNDRLVGNGGGDDLIGGGGRDSLLGGGGRDDLDGGRGRDELNGGGGADELNGGGGADTLFGSRGADVNTGGGGRDLFVFTLKDRKETITDFQHGKDRIDLVDVDDFAALDLQQLGDDVVLKLGRLDLVLQDQELDAFDEADFVF